LALVDTLGIADTSDVIGTWWPMVVIAFGLAGLIGQEGSRLGAGIVITVGVLLQLGQLDVGDINWPSIIGPALLILIGLALLLRPRHVVGPFGSASQVENGETLHTVALFSGSEPHVHSGAWQGGEATAIFGGVEVDLHDAVPVPGARLQATALFGGVDIHVPEGWEVVLNGTGILGGVGDERRNRTAAQGAPVLTVDATAIFGGVTVKDN
jgi:hypothetical protein